MTLPAVPDGAGPAPARGREASAALRRLLVALTKVALVGEGVDTTQWRAEALEAQRQVAGAAGDAMAPSLDDLWVSSVKAAECDPAVRRAETVNPMLPTISPVGLDQLSADPFDLDAAIHAVRDAASFG